MAINQSAINQTLSNATTALLDARDARGVWVGELSSSALSTAVTIFALHLHGEHATLVDAGRDWLLANRNSDGGWGDTTRSKSNISTTTLCHAALHAIGIRDEPSRAWLMREIGSLEPAAWSEAIADRYGADRTFSVPILTMAALAGVLGGDGFAYVKQLPFELAAFPRSWFAELRLPVVSYALPALIAIGQVRHVHRSTRNFFARLVRDFASGPTRKTLREIQPSSGGYLEATPLTAFVVMSLVAAGHREHAVVRDGVEFLINSFRADGSVAIDTNLATWVTTLSISALAQQPSGLAEVDCSAVCDWLLGQQYREVHSYTNSPPGGFAWTDLPGGVPDADDTSGALLALHALGCDEIDAVEAAVRWLIDLQNRDGGVPTFCRGWGKLPFDRSSTDITAHAIRAWRVWRSRVSAKLQQRIDRATGRAKAYLKNEQTAVGQWMPLWFGNEDHPENRNPAYGTARVTLAFEENDQLRRQASQTMIDLSQQVQSIEELALIVRSLPIECDAMEPAVNRLIELTDGGSSFPASPIGFYFANLWYSERLYPLIWTVEALGYARANSDQP